MNKVYRIKKNMNLIKQRILLKFLKNSQKVEISKILIGQQGGLPLKDWLDLTNEKDRLSCPITNSPYVSFLSEVSKNESLLDSSFYLENCKYFKMGLKCILATGHYLGAHNSLELKKWMVNFYKRFKYKKEGKGELDNLSETNQPIKTNLPVLSKIKKSDCYEIIDGHHRAAIAFMLGEKKIYAHVIGSKYSVLQKMLLKINQIHDIELYQPVDRLEVKSWPVVRNCKDRFEMMKKFIRKIHLTKGSIIDLACSYGWFPYNFKKLGFDVMALDRDPRAIEIAQIIYGLDKHETKYARIEEFLQNNNKKYDLVLFLSILHHYAIGKEKGKVKEILGNLDKMTTKVLFLDTGQSHEKWNRKRLSQWDDNYIINLIKENTSFKEVIPLGKDNDNRGKYKDNYGRTLFACIR